VRERRYTQGAIEARSAGDALTISGHASVFDQPYELWGFREQVKRGAFKKSLKEGDIAALWNHDPSIILGRKKSGTLRLEEDDVGLRYEVDMPDTQAARDLYTLIERGDVYQSSFAFEIQREEWVEPEEDSRELPLRIIKQVRLWDVSPVTYPASTGTDVDVQRALRSFAEALGIETYTAETVPDLWALAREAKAATETQAVAQPEEAPDATSPQEPKRIRLPF
jgi:HK97 family phage prohead protease